MKIVGKVYNGLVISAYEVEDEEHNKSILKTSELVKIIKNGEIENGIAVYNVDKHGYEVHCTDDISLLNEVNNKKEYYVTCRIVNKSNGIIGYIIKDSNDTPYRIDRAKMWKLTVNKQITNAKVRGICKGRKFISIDDIENIDKVVDTKS